MRIILDKINPKRKIDRRNDYRNHMVIPIWSRAKQYFKEFNTKYTDIKRIQSILNKKYTVIEKELISKLNTKMHSEFKIKELKIANARLKVLNSERIEFLKSLKPIIADLTEKIIDIEKDYNEIKTTFKTEKESNRFKPPEEDKLDVLLKELKTKLKLIQTINMVFTNNGSEIDLYLKKIDVAIERLTKK